MYGSTQPLLECVVYSCILMSAPDRLHFLWTIASLFGLLFGDLWCSFYVFDNYFFGKILWIFFFEFAVKQLFDEIFEFYLLWFCFIFQVLCKIANRVSILLFIYLSDILHYDLNLIIPVMIFIVYAIWEVFLRIILNLKKISLLIFCVLIMHTLERQAQLCMPRLKLMFWRGILHDYQVTGRLD